MMTRRSRSSIRAIVAGVVIAVGGAPWVGAEAQVGTVAAPTNVAEDVGLSDVSRTYSVTVADFNNDGVKDFFYVRHNPQLSTDIPPPSLYMGSRSGDFLDWNMALQALAVSWGGRDRHGCDVADVI